jgi:hypothetical protein
MPLSSIVTTVDLQANVTTIEVVQGGAIINNSGGSPAIGFVLNYPIVAGLTLLTGAVVELVAGELRLASIDDPVSAYNTVGIYDSAAGHVVASGKITYSGWNWTLGQPLFLGRGGNLVHIPLVDSPFYLQVATVLTSTEIRVDIQQPIYT